MTYKGKGSHLFRKEARKEGCKEGRKQERKEARKKGRKGARKQDFLDSGFCLENQCNDSAMHSHCVTSGHGGGCHDHKRGVVQYEPTINACLALQKIFWRGGLFQSLGYCNIRPNRGSSNPFLDSVNQQIHLILFRAYS